MSQRFIEVTTDHPTNEEPYKLLLQIGQIVQIRPELIMTSEPKHDPIAIVTLTTGETLALKNSYASVAAELDEVNMVVRP
ncbi:hypothetical protein [Marinobacterium aestuariivivens]|uniref:Uncharacterized protein n=1 Tax=Marinobacterium aestuariivivens TaxID=1698799 RepID=A0ABW2A327_9GAMM